MLMMHVLGAIDFNTCWVKLFNVSGTTEGSEFVKLRLKRKIVMDSSGEKTVIFNRNILLLYNQKLVDRLAKYFEKRRRREIRHA
jgi:hypothetical protein